MDGQQQQLIDRIKQAQNILVTVSSNPSVDQLAAAIGLTVALNKLDKHGTAVFSGQIPSTIEFLKPEETLEKNTDSLRDFIIALDKSKADKLRYKVEDQVVRIFITPYKTSLSQDDLDFSQGDFNVDVVVALGVSEQQDLDAAITAHGRILHDATVASVGTGGQGSLGTINWVDASASSLSEMMVSLVDGLDKKLLDNQIATALLTGIVAATERFRNEKTTPRTMSASAELMAAGANQQLVATQLDAPIAPVAQPAADGQGGAPDTSAPQPPREPGTLEINHDTGGSAADDTSTSTLPPLPEPAQVQVSEDGQLFLSGNDADASPLPGGAVTPAASAADHDEPPPTISKVRGISPDGRATESDAALPAPAPTVIKRELLTGDPTLAAADITANMVPEGLEPSTEELTLPPVPGPLLTHNESVLSPSDPAVPASDLATASVTLPPVADSNAPFTPPQPPAVPPLPDAPALPPAAPAPFTPPPAAPFTPPPPAATPLPPAPAPPAFSPSGTLSHPEQTANSPRVHISEDGTLSNVPAPAIPGDDTAPPIPAAPAADVADARSAVVAALNGTPASAAPLAPVAALNAQPLGPDLHPDSTAPFTPPPPAATPLPPAPAPVAHTDFSEPAPGTTPADGTLDMPLPSNPFGPGQSSVPSPSTAAPLSGAAPAVSPFSTAAASSAPAPSAFPGAPAAPAGATPPPPPVPPPMFPLQ